MIKMINNDFEKVVHIMNLSCIAKIRDCVASAKWTQKDVEQVLRDSGIKVESLVSFSHGDSLDTIGFNAMVPFKANEIKGIVASFYYWVHAEVTLNQKFGRYEIKVFFGPKKMLDSENDALSYDVDWLYSLFYKNSGHSMFKSFVSSEFDYAYYCQLFNQEPPHYARIAMSPNFKGV